MSRLIDADRLRELLKNDWVQITPIEENRDVFYHNSGYNCAAFRAYLLVDKQPTVDPVVRGRWKYYHKKNIAVCTNCSFERDLDANFGRAICCPNCGANMD